MTKEQTALLERVEQSFLPLLKGSFGENLVTVTLYGSAAGGRFIDRVSDVNVLILISESDSSSLTTFGKRAAKAIRKNRITPLILTEDEFQSSADVFPMEYLDIQDTRRVLLGTDSAGQLEIDRRHLRHQVEQELRGAVASLRQALIDSRGRNRHMRRTLTQWFGSQAALFRGLLRLAAIAEVPVEPAETIEALGSTFEIDTAPLKQTERLRSGDKLAAVEIAEALVDCLVELVTRVDALDTQE